MSIKYILIGNPENCEEIGHYPEKGASKEIANTSNLLFKKYIESGKYKKEERQKINSKGECFYYMIVSSDNIFYLICGDNNLKEREAYDLIDKLQKKNIPPLIDSGLKKLNFEEKQQFKAAVENFINNDMDKIRKVQIGVNEAKDTMKENLKNLYKNVDDIKDLDVKAEDLKNSSDNYYKASHKLSWATWCQKYKWYIILAAVIVLLIIIIIPISIKKK